MTPIKRMTKKQLMEMITQSEDCDFYQEQFTKITEMCKENGFSTQALTSYIFANWIQYNIKGDLLKRFNDIRDKGKGVTKEKRILLFGEKYGMKSWNEYCSKQAETNTLEYKQEKYGMSEDEFKEFNKSRAVTKENLISKHGKDIGLEKWESYCQRQSYTNSLEYFIDKFGKDEGTKFFKNLNKSKSQTLENFIKRYGEKEGHIKYLQYRDRNGMNGGVSPISQDLFKEIEGGLHCYYGYKNHEFGKYDKENRRYYFYDFVAPDIKLCIEFNGDDFHANPDIYSNENYKHPFDKEMLAEEIWEYDRIKNQLIKNSGYELIIIWEKEYRKNKDAIIKELKEKIDELIRRDD